MTQAFVEEAPTEEVGQAPLENEAVADNTEAAPEAPQGDEGQATEDYSFDAVAAKKGFKSADDLAKSYIELEKKFGDGKLKAQAKQLEEETGLSLEDLLLAARNEEREDAETVTTPTQPEEFDKELFDNLVDQRFNEKYGPQLKQLSEFGKYAAKISSKEATQQLPADYKEFEADIVAFLEANKDLAKTDAGVKTAYYAVKGMKSDEISQKAALTKENEINNKEEVKNLAFVENSKNDKTVKTTTNIEDILALSNEEYSKLPQEIKEQILRSL